MILAVDIAGTPENTKETHKTIRSCKLSKKYILLPKYLKRANITTANSRNEAAKICTKMASNYP